MGPSAGFCVVGLGAHALTKLIPAIQANGQRLISVVSSKTTAPADTIHARLEDALAVAPKGAVFVLATPPDAHFEQAMAVLRAGFDLIVEKPAFVTGQEARAAAALSRSTGAVIAEAFMQRHTALYSRALAEGRRGGVRRIEARFLIPQMPGGTFRHGASIGASTLCDIGCYPLSLFADLDLDLAGLTLTRFDHPGDPDRERLRLEGRSGGVELIAEIGVADAYANTAAFDFDDGDRIEFSPFFYGRSGVRTIKRQGVADEALDETNAFEAMFATSRAAWLAGQDQRLDRMIAVTDALERLGADVLSQRL